jgi:hypothetical protein
MTVKQDFDSGTIGWEVLFIFISGMIGDMGVHLLCDTTKNTSIEFAQGLSKYYESLGDKLLVFNTTNWSNINKSISGWVQGAIWGGIACVIALLMMKLFLFAKEETEYFGNPNFTTYVDDVNPKLRHPEWPAVRGGQKME